MENDWKNNVNDINELFTCWDGKKEQLASLFRKRDKQAVTSPMIEQTANFIKAVYLINNMPLNNNLISWQVDLENAAIRPINLQERLTFISESPAHYHSFIQLAELFEELRKQFEKVVAMNTFKNDKERD